MLTILDRCWGACLLQHVDKRCANFSGVVNGRREREPQGKRSLGADSIKVATELVDTSHMCTNDVGAPEEVRQQLNAGVGVVGVHVRHDCR